MDKIKVLHIAECAGGVEKYLLMLMPLLNEQNIEQYFVCSKKYEISNFINWNKKIIQFDMKQTFNIFSVFFRVREIRRAIRTISPDIVYCHSSFGGVYGRLAVLGLKCKIIYNPHGWAFNMK